MANSNRVLRKKYSFYPVAALVRPESMVPAHDRLSILSKFHQLVVGTATG